MYKIEYWEVDNETHIIYNKYIIITIKNSKLKIKGLKKEKHVKDRLQRGILCFM